MYWDGAGKEYTEKTIDLALKTAKEKGIKHIVVASNTGSTAKLLENCGLNVVCVTHANGFKEPGENEMDSKMRKELESKGVRVMTGTHVLSGAERGLSSKFGGIYPLEIMSNTLRMFGQGIKVCVEISVMALDAGMIPHGECIIAIGGTNRGADSAVILKPAHARDILKTKIEEIICKPR
ncbi:MAG: pyruvate kinase alpha/beta domain-containing protein [Caulobacteraceae bacterium]